MLANSLAPLVELHHAQSRYLPCSPLCAWQLRELEAAAGAAAVHSHDAAMDRGVGDREADVWRRAKVCTGRQGKVTKGSKGDRKAEKRGGKGWRTRHGHASLSMVHLLRACDFLLTRRK
jgi:hypothetical protein